MQFSRNPNTFFFMSLDQPAPHAGESVLGQLSIGDVHARSDVASKTAACIESRHTDVKDPTVLSIMAPDAILHLKRLPLIKGQRIGFQAALQIFIVYSCGPAVSQFC